MNTLFRTRIRRGWAIEDVYQRPARSIGLFTKDNEIIKKLVYEGECKFPRSEILNFYCKVIFGDGCWEWQGYIDNSGYGFKRINFLNVYERVHRISWLIHRGKIGNLCVCHQCDNRRCVRPSHLFLGTKKDNAQDMIEKWRGKPVSFPGESNPSHRLKNSQILEIRKRLENGETVSVLAKDFQVTRHHVNRIKRRLSWNNI